MSAEAWASLVWAVRPLLLLDVAPARMKLPSRADGRDLKTMCVSALGRSLSV